tara:strand:+ start:352 stop:753 length:402 start_codon:yes stop_codon:yes gene_type:complete
MKIDIPISCGELIDKLTILEIKLKNIKDDNKKKHIKNEYDHLSNISKKLQEVDLEQYKNFYTKLMEINQLLWKIEDDIREQESKNMFQEKFVELARAVYTTNDQRFAVKNEINIFYDSDIQEQKELISYDQKT